MTISYLALLIFVTCLLIGLIVLPFCKFSKRLRNNHPALWNTRGPFEIGTLVTNGAMLTEFTTLIREIEADQEMEAKDAALSKWARLSGMVMDIAPKSFLGQIGLLLAILYAVGFFTAVISRVIGL